KALDVNRRLKSKEHLAITFNTIGQFYHDLKDYKKAADYYERALTMSEEMGAKSQATTNLITLGKLHADQAQWDQAMARFEKALAMSLEMGAKAAVSKVQHLIGTVRFEQNEFGQAVARFLNSIEIIEELRLTARGAVRRDYLETQIDTYRWLISAYLRNGEPEAAFNVVELASAKYLVEQLSRKFESKTVPIVSISEYRSKKPGYTGILSFANVDWKKTVTRFIAVRKGVSASELSTEPLMYGINNKYQMEISLAAEKTGGRGLTIKKAAGRTDVEIHPELDAIVSYYRSLLANPSLNPTQQRARQEISRSLYDLLFSGVEETLKDKKTLIIIPGGVLAFLPFESLMMPDGRYLVEKYNIQYTQSLTVQNILEKRRYGEGKRPLLAFGGAVYQEQSYKEAVIESENQMEALKESTQVAISRGLEVGGVYHRLGYGRWANLPGTLTEVNRIGEILPGSRIVTGEAVDEWLVKRMSAEGEMKRYRVIHFATHGLVVPEMAELSALVLSQLKVRNDSEDGYFRMSEVLDLDLEADFVNLSACETGLGKLYGGEGVVGLTQSFLVGGANGVSVSLWQVADESTMEFMTGLYRFAWEQGLSYPEAMTLMKRQFIRSRYSDPFFWAPFVFYGR
ncbi:MAG TPA: CHAT domain-containing tetratricopeptide repeat protein, partial [Spirochaetia bacterium]|nr:CHAT domain-containing tetratricopeptide repeat protein [Spirochaetia bacterium]